jgi:thiol-disulfide isomerase/thioredoxin
MNDDLQADITASLTRAEEMWERGELHDSRITLEETLVKARSNPYRVKFRTRVQLATLLAGLYLALDEVQSARSLISDEAAFAREIFQLIQMKGTAGQKRAATGDFVQLCDLETKISLIGHVAPDISIEKWINSEPLSLQTLRGRVVLLEFWATWCEPCEEMIPVLKRLHDEYAARGLLIVALTRHYLAYQGADEEQMKELELVQSYIAKHEITYPVGIAEDEQAQELYGANGLPSLVLVDRRGIVRYSYGSGEDDQFKRLLAECLAG